MSKRTVVVTGMGLVSCFGSDVDHFYRELLAGKSGICQIEDFVERNYSTQFGAPVSGLEVGTYIERKVDRRLDPNIRFALVAGKRALESAAFDLEHLALDKARCGILVGTGIGGMRAQEEGVRTLHERGYRRISPFYCPHILTNMAGAYLGIDLGFTGPNYAISTACASANYCLLSALRHIERGDADLMLAGGTESCLSPMGMAGFIACRAVSQRNDDPASASRPWDQDRDGFVMAEGAGVLALESLEHARARGAPILAEFCGGAINCDGHHLTDPLPGGEGVAACMRSALVDAGHRPIDVDYLNAHATSTPAGDLAELRALTEVFRGHERLRINATKSMIGHSLGASAALEAIATIMALRQQVVHPTLNLHKPEPLLPHAWAPTRAERLDLRLALSNSSGFGGHNSCLAFSRWHES